jgi:ribonuclease HII
LEIEFPVANSGLAMTLNNNIQIPTKVIDLFEFDADIRSQLKLDQLCGVDEAGRGPLAGPVVAAAVILPPEFRIDGLNDSKKLSAKKRDQFAVQIKEHALGWAVTAISPVEIDKINILQATFKAMRTVVGQLSATVDFLVVDGRDFPFDNREGLALIRGDSRSASIAAASILAKTTRDEIMREADLAYPGYGFARHKGYGTALHYAQLQQRGPCEIHRKSFRLD